MHKPSVKDITATLKQLKDNKTLGPSFSALIDIVVKDESALYVNKRHYHGSIESGSKPWFDDFNWKNSKG
jgi:hypothetical protein